MPLKSIVAALILLSALGTWAQDSDLPAYQVEIIVVRNLSPSTGTEVFPLIIEPEESELPGETFTSMERDTLTLSDMAGKISRSRNFRVVSHSGWIQPGFSREDARRKVMRRTASTGESVSGDLTLSRERYLRLAMNLTMDIEGEQYQLKAQRRMISRQVHYFDNPHFGVIAKITPL